VFDTVYGHFGPKTLNRTQDISALVPKCLGQFGTKVHEMS